MKKIGLVALFILWTVDCGLLTISYAQETLEILTYYPAPYGVYRFLQVIQSSTTGNTSLEALRLTHEDSDGIGSSGIGAYLSFTLETTSNGIFPEAARIEAVLDDVAIASKDASLRFYTLGPNAAVAVKLPTEKMRIDSSGNVGIGTNAPGYITGAQKYLSISPPCAGFSNELSSLELRGRTSTTNTSIGKIDFISSTNLNVEANIARIDAIITDDQAEGRLLFYTNGGTITEQMRITEHGNVGIGVDPTAKLHVNGNIKVVLGTISGQYWMQYNPTTQEIGYYAGDIAELFETNEEVEPGDILTIDENRKLKLCDKGNDTKVAGIVSNAPAILFEGSELQIAPEPFQFQKGTKPPVALAGRVICNVDTSYGEIQPGDLLTTSPTPGHAMKAKPIGEINGYPIYPQGCIIGKALEGLKEGKGKILVLVCLM